MQWHAMTHLQGPKIAETPKSHVSLYWLVHSDSPIGLLYPQYIGSTVPELIINQQGFSSHCSCCHNLGCPMVSLMVFLNMTVGPRSLQGRVRSVAHPVCSPPRSHPFDRLDLGPTIAAGDRQGMVFNDDTKKCMVKVSVYYIIYRPYIAK